MATTTARNEREKDILIIFFAEVRQLLLLFPRSSFLLSFLLLFFSWLYQKSLRDRIQNPCDKSE
mgnify:FL=1|jgi:hypothetical protein